MVSGVALLFFLEPSPEPTGASEATTGGLMMKFAMVRFVVDELKRGMEMALENN